MAGAAGAFAKSGEGASVGDGAAASGAALLGLGVIFSPALFTEVFSLLLKSVSYQPVPLRIKFVRLTNFSSLLSPQLGQALGAGSDIFCKNSEIVPHFLHSYSYRGIAQSLDMELKKIKYRSYLQSDCELSIGESEIYAEVGNEWVTRSGIHQWDDDRVVRQE